jgi:hypothetical protein
MKNRNRPLIIFLWIVILLNFFTMTWAVRAETPEDRQNMLRIADDIKKALKTKDLKILLPYMMEKESLYFGSCGPGDVDPRDEVYSFNKFSEIFHEHTKDVEVRLKAAGFSVGFDDARALDFETEGGVPKEYRYLYFLFRKTREGWKWGGICNDSMRLPDFKPSQEFKQAYL